MATLRIKLCGINNVDMASLNSVLQLSDSRLNNQWQISHSGQIDLFIYSLDTEEGRSMLRNHRRGVSAALALKNQTNALADFIIKKPIRTKQIAETLNAAAEKIKATKQTDIVAAKPTEISAKKPKVKSRSAPEPKLKQVKKVSLLSSLSKHLKRHKSPPSDLPALNLSIPVITDTKLKTLDDPKTLAKWMASLPVDNHQIIIDALLEKMMPLNRTVMPINNRLALLELYRTPVNDFIFKRDVDTVKLEMSKPAIFEANLDRLNVFLEEITLGYKLIVMEAYLQGHRPSLDNQFLFAIIRATEAIGLFIINAFRHYRHPPMGLVNELHQLYLYCEAGVVLDKRASLKIAETKKPFIHYYSQLMLTSIADPYSLGKYDVFRLFNLMAKMADKVTITPLSEHQMQADNTAASTSNFCLECHSDRLAFPYSFVTTEGRQRSETRQLNPRGVLIAIEQIFDAAASTSTLGRYDLDIQLLKKVSPQFNASYQRQFERLAPITERPIRLANGFDAIHYCLISTDDTHTTEWTIGNQGSGGLMAKCSKSTMPALNVGDFMGVFEANLPARLATIRWLHIDKDDILQVGLVIHPGNPAAIYLLPKGKATEEKCLYLPAISEIGQAETMIVGKGGYSRNRTFHVKDAEKTYTIVAQKLLNYSLNYEQFNYKTVG